ncbi:MAG: hypothetical protein FWD82_01275 [Defluviitaleaceae bacterium]|nr:hypothetical protein [Defluviitaleaceae bacterium]
MYKTVIEFKNDIPNEKMNELFNLCDEAFDNRIGRATRLIELENQVAYEGDEALCGCLQIGTSILRRTDGFLKYVKSWEWIEDDPDECCDMFEIFEKYVG